MWRIIGMGLGLVLALAGMQAPARAGDKPQAASVSGTVYLRAAAAGDYSNVLLISFFGGKVPLPRTAVLMRPAGKQAFFSMGVHPEVPLSLAGIVPGNVMLKGGVRFDPERGIPLPMGSTESQTIGPLQVENYPARSTRLESGVLVTNGSEYLWFTDEAVPLAVEVAKAFVSLKGPNAARFQAEAEAPKAATDATGALTGCFGTLVRAESVYSQGKLSGLRLYPKSNDVSPAFTSLGLVAGDVFVGGKSSEPSLGELDRLLAASLGAPTVLRIVRGGETREVVVPKEKARAVCKASDV